jgi:hypothetical protein
MKIKCCEWCGNQFETSVSYQIYCTPECRESATKEKIAERYAIVRRRRRFGKPRNCKGCSQPLSVYNDDTLCQSCLINPNEVSKVLREIRGMANGKKSTE